MTVQRPSHPTWRDLPVSDGIPLEDNNHPIQATVYLAEPLRRWLEQTHRQAFVGCNCFVYYQMPKRAKGPDFFVVNEGKWTDQGSWVIWDEDDLAPSLIVELLSPSTEKYDRTGKREFYRTVFKTADYFLYDTGNQRFEGWQLADGDYVPVSVLPGGRVRCQSLPLQLGVVGKWLRWFTLDGDLVLTDKELAEQAERHAEQAQQEAEQARQQVGQTQVLLAEERSRAEREKLRADEAERELRALRDKLRPD